MGKTRRVLAISEAPTQYHIDIFRKLALADCGFEAIYGSPGQVAGKHYASWGQSLVKNETGLLEGYESRILNSSSFHSIFRVLSDMNVGREDTVLFHTVLPTFTRTAAMVCRLLGARLIFRGSSNLPRYSSRRMNLVRIIRDVSSFQLFHGFCATGTVTWRYFKNFAPRKPIVFSPYCADEYVLAPIKAQYDQHRNAVRSELKISNEDTLVVYMGRFIDLKNLDNLLSAYAAVDGAGIQLALGGDGPNKADLLKRIASHEWIHRPKYLGFLNRQSVGRVFCGADALALPSFQETWGAVVNEAFHLNNLCMTTDAAGCAADLIIEGANGTIVDPHSVDSIASGLRTLQKLHHKGDFVSVNEQLCSMFSSSNATNGILTASGFSQIAQGFFPPGLDK